MPNFVVQTDAGPINVERSAITLPEGMQVFSTAELNDKYVQKSILKHTHEEKDEFQKKLDARFKNWVKKDDVLKDESIIAEVLKEHGEAGIDIEAAEKNWEAEKYTPLKEENEALRSLLVRRDTEAAAKTADVDDQYLTPMKPGKPSFIEVQFGDAIQYDPKLKYAVAHDEDGKPIHSKKATNDRPFQDANEYFADLSESGALDAYRKTPRKNSGVPAHSNGDGKSAPAPVRMSDMSDEQQAEYILEHGVEKYTELPD